MAVNQPVSQKGKIFAYYEQGWEGRIEFAFSPKNAQNFIFLQTGDYMTLYNHDNSILFQGKIKFCRRRFWDKHKLTVDIWSFRKQKGVSYEKWMQWFWQEPNLKAELIRVNILK